VFKVSSGILQLYFLKFINVSNIHSIKILVNNSSNLSCHNGVASNAAISVITTSQGYFTNTIGDYQVN